MQENSSITQIPSEENNIQQTESTTTTNQENESIQAFITAFVNMKKRKAELKTIFKESRESMKKMKQKLEKFMEENASRTTCWTIPRRNACNLYLRYESKPSYSALSLKVLEESIGNITPEFLIDIHEELKEKKEVKSGERQITPKYLFEVALLESIKQTRTQEPKRIVTITEKCERHILTEEERALRKNQPKKKKNSGTNSTGGNEIERYPIPEQDILLTVLEYHMEEWRLKKKKQDFLEYEKQKQDKVGPLEYRLNVENSANGVAQNKKGVGLDQMSETMKNVKAFLNRVNPEKKSFKFPLAGPDGTPKPYVMKEKPRTRKPSFNMGSVKNVVSMTLERIFPSDSKNIETENDVNVVIQQIASDQNKAALFSVLKNSLDQYNKENVSRSVSYTIDRCNNERKKRTRTKPQQKKIAVPVIDEEEDESQLDGFEKKRRKVEKATTKYKTSVESSKQKLGNAPTLNIQIEDKTALQYLDGQDEEEDEDKNCSDEEN